ncbi:MAG TPA: glycosyltransferase [Tepidisphaeraceae bacterium]|nr:glycosyltransferase [Tepidisphaeraceae bacterium]
MSVIEFQPKLAAERDHCPVLHVVYREGLGSVFEPMVVSPVTRLVRAGFPARIAVFCPIGEMVRPRLRKRWQGIERNIAVELDGSVHRLPSPPSRAMNAWNEAAYFQRWFDWHYPKPNSPVLLHCRGSHATHLGLGVRRNRDVKVIYDMRGVEHAEQLYVRNDLKSANNLEDLEATAARSSDAVICVSNRMKEFACGRYGIDAGKIAVAPCCVDMSAPDPMLARNANRLKLGITERFVVAYCGGAHSWQLPRQSTELFLKIQSAIPRAHYLVLTPAVEQLKHILQQLNVRSSDATVMNVPHDQVATHLAAADVGLLIRERSLINEVAAPVKFGEYLRSSLPVIISEGVGDYSQLVRSEQLGFVLDDHRDPSAFLTDYVANPIAWRDRCRRAAHEHLSSDLLVNSWMDLYRQLSL